MEQTSRQQRNKKLSEHHGSVDELKHLLLTNVSMDGVVSIPREGVIELHTDIDVFSFYHANHYRWRGIKEGSRIRVQMAKNGHNYINFEYLVSVNVTLQELLNVITNPTGKKVNVQKMRNERALYESLEELSESIEMINEEGKLNV